MTAASRVVYVLVGVAGLYFLTYQHSVASFEPMPELRHTGSNNRWMTSTVHRFRQQSAGLVLLENLSGSDGG